MKTGLGVGNMSARLGIGRVTRGVEEDSENEEFSSFPTLNTSFPISHHAAISRLDLLSESTVNIYLDSFSLPLLSLPLLQLTSCAAK